MRVIEDIKRRIEQGRIKCGERLPTEIALVKEFGVSRTVVREAITALAVDGFVEPRQGSGVFVLERREPVAAPQGGAVLAFEDNLLGILEFRLAVEIESAALAATRRSLAQETEIRRRHAAFAEAMETGRTTVEEDLAFHFAIAEATGNCCFTEVVRALGPLAIREGYAAMDEAHEGIGGQRRTLRITFSEHEAILDAIASGDAENARSAMRLHLSGSRRRLGDGHALDGRAPSLHNSTHR
ncbi:FadR/GntR family transcriptional regulator [Methylobrevis pamukkalensis]|uniref:FadR/GntR family transcriptional regulator n=1 Tax=Methylobrevis pamukkalensis TaxID=1439726 RepID=UPI000845C805|nr:FadR/GntR family transcriptional regulator [Methylobrevis pamukkalensis]